MEGPLRDDNTRMTLVREPFWGSFWGRAGQREAGLATLAQQRERSGLGVGGGSLGSRREAAGPGEECEDPAVPPDTAMTWTDVLARLQDWTSQVVQGLRICLPMQGTQVQTPVQEDSTCSTTKLACHNY